MLNIGTVVVTATQPASGNYLGNSITAELSINKGPPVITFANVTKTYSTATFTISATSNSTGTLSYSSMDNLIATVSGTSVTMLKAGVVNIKVSQLGTNNYFSAEKEMTLTINKATPSITFNNITQSFSNTSFTVSASSLSEGLFIYTITDTTKATVSGSSVTMVNVGTTDITATQEETDKYLSFFKKVSLTINKGTAPITFSIPNQILGDTPITLLPISDSTGLYTYVSSKLNVATVSGSILTTVNEGTVVITATQASTSNYNSNTKTANLTVIKPTASNPAVVNNSSGLTNLITQLSAVTTIKTPMFVSLSSSIEISSIKSSTKTLVLTGKSVDRKIIKLTARKR